MGGLQKALRGKRPPQEPHSCLYVQGCNPSSCHNITHHCIEGERFTVAPVLLLQREGVEKKVHGERAVWARWMTWDQYHNPFAEIRLLTFNSLFLQSTEDWCSQTGGRRQDRLGEALNIILLNNHRLGEAVIVFFYLKSSQVGGGSQLRAVARKIDLEVQQNQKVSLLLSQFFIFFSFSDISSFE